MSAHVHELMARVKHVIIFVAHAQTFLSEGTLGTVLAVFRCLNFSARRPGDSLGTAKTLGTSGTTFYLGQVSLHFDNLECRAQE